MDAARLTLNATLARLAKEENLSEHAPPLGRRQLACRSVYLMPGLVQWFRTVLPKLIAMDGQNIDPRGQVASLLKQFVAGERMDHEHLLKKLEPLGKDIWELKTPDVRIFGFFISKDHFLAVVADSMELTKTYDLYRGYVNFASDERERMGIPEALRMRGASYNDVISV